MMLGNQAQQQKDIEVTAAPSDSISDLAFSKTSDLLAAASWNNEVRIWEVMGDGSTVAKAMYSHEGPALVCQWSPDGSKLASGGADSAGRMFDVTTGQPTQFAKHDAPIKGLRWVDGANIVATGSWDKTIKYWDIRQPTPVSSVALSDRLYSMDTHGSLLVAATADRSITMYDMSNPAVPFRTMESPLKMQTRVVSCFTTGGGFAVGSIEGRVAIQYTDVKDSQGNFSFKCHRDGAPSAANASVYAVNAISFHPVFGTFATAGSDGGFTFWDKDSKQKLKVFNKQAGPISAATFNRNGSIYAYAVSYDWSKGYTGASESFKNTIMLSPVSEADIKPRKK
ncbi:mRNA export factor [Entomortierella parvispora]|uniref:mRNA export factor n=1 Tax=Entomortierella parvispora TaxID=205924 RepID=A0A9P3HBJ6_9FUNG|nr:mRNA export factor [Entomortierella parvispora]